MTTNEALSIGNNLMQQAEAAILTTLDNNQAPQTRAMLNLRNSIHFPGLASQFHEHKNDFFCLFTTNTSSEKIHQLETNSLVSIYFCKPDQWTGLMLGGSMVIVRDPIFKKSIWQPEWQQYYAKGVHDPDYAVLSLLPTQAKLYHQLSTHEFNLRSNLNG